MRKILLITIFTVSTLIGLAQEKKKDSPSEKKGNTLIDLAIGAGSSQSLVSSSFVHNWSIGKKQKLQLGIGLRLTNSFGKDQYFTTANAKLTSGKTGPAVLFADDIPANVDSFFVGNAQVNALNISFNSEYSLTKKWSVGFNIDLIGISVGASKNGTYINNGNKSIVGSKPTTANVLLISDNDLGSLNSEVFARYKLNSKWSLRGGAAFLFNEYTTNTAVQQINGIKNDRFRDKTLNLMVGISYHF
jgi:hypothetical protein